MAPLLKMKDGFSMADFSSDTVFIIRPDKAEIEPFFVRTPPWTQMSSPLYVYPIFEGGPYIFMEYQITKEEAGRKRLEFARLVYDRSDGETYTPVVVNGDYEGWTHPLSAYFEQRTIKFGVNTVTLPTIALIDALEEGKLHGKLKEVASTLKEDDNPVLMVMTFK